MQKLLCTPFNNIACPHILHSRNTQDCQLEYCNGIKYWFIIHQQSSHLYFAFFLLKWIINMTYIEIFIDNKCFNTKNCKNETIVTNLFSTIIVGSLNETLHLLCYIFVCMSTLFSTPHLDRCSKNHTYFIINTTRSSFDNKTRRNITFLNVVTSSANNTTKTCKFDYIFLF